MSLTPFCGVHTSHASVEHKMQLDANSPESYSKQVIRSTILSTALHQILLSYLYAVSRSPELFPGIYVFYRIILYNMR